MKAFQFIINIVAAVLAYYFCHYLRSRLPEGVDAGWFRGLIDAGSIEGNLAGKFFSAPDSAPFGSTYDLMVPRHSWGYTLFFWIGICGKVFTYTVGTFLSGKAAEAAEEVGAEIGLRQIADDFRKETGGKGRMVDEATRLDDIVAGPGKAMCYKFTVFPGNPAPDLDASTVAEMRARIVAQLSSDADIRSMFDQGVVGTWQYRDASGKLLTEIRMSKDGELVVPAAARKRVRVTSSQ